MFKTFENKSPAKGMPMPRDAVRTLFHPFLTGDIEAPAAGERWLFLGAETGFTLPEGFLAELKPVQPFRPLYRQLEQARLDPSVFAEGEALDGALILMDRHRGASERMLAEAIARVKIGGLIVVAGSKEDGVQSLRKRLYALDIEPEHLSKHHAQAFWFGRPDADTARSLSEKLSPAPGLVDKRFVTAAGMFSYQEVDAGSAFLARYLPADAKGEAADFAAGWGYLSVMLAEAAPALASIDLYEADHAALEAARKNLKANVPGVESRFHWVDLVGETVKERFDLIVMNPPFHEGHASQPGIGQAMIRRAADALRPGGQLLMVANRGLPYEPVLAEAFKQSGETARNARYKVLWAKK